MHDAVIAPAARALLHADAAIALLDHRAGIDIAARCPAHGQRLTRNAGLIDHRFARDNLAVERDHAAGAHGNAVSDLYVAHGDKDAARIRLQPNLVDIERHGLRQIRHGLLMRPLIEDVTHAEQEHDRTGRIKVTAQHRDGDCRRVEHRHLDLAVHQAGKAGLDITGRARNSQRRAKRVRKEELADCTAADSKHKLVLIFTSQRPAAMLGRKRAGLFI